MDDRALLEQFAARGDETAFRSLVNRHAALVHSIARRHVQKPHLAEDVAQAVFILLARKADRVRKETVLSGWLFQATRFLAQRAMRSEQRRQRREQEALAMQSQGPPEPAWEQIAPDVDEALGQLKRSDRDALLLRFFEGRSLREVGEQIGSSEEAAKKRVARAVDKVRTLLARRGWTLSAAALGASMGQQASAALPADVLSQLSDDALNSVSPPTPAARLAEEWVAAQRWAKLKLAAALSSSVVLLGLLSLELDRRRDVGIDEPSPIPSQENLSAGALNPVAAGSPMTAADKSPAKMIRFRAVHALTGQGIAHARVAYTVWVNRAQERHFDAATDAQGECAIFYPSETGRLDIGVVQDGFEARYATWPSEGVSGIPEEYTLRLHSVTNVINGQVLDPSGQPLSEVAIWFKSADAGDSSHRERPRERFGFLDAMPVTSTDDQGRWSVGFIPQRHPGFSFEARHADFADTLIVSSSGQHSLEEPAAKAQRNLAAATLISSMRPAFTLTGLVLDERGAPIAGARVQEREQSTIFFSDASGAFKVPKLPPQTRAFTVSADGFAPERRTVEIGPELRPLVVTLRTGAVLRLRVVDEHGNWVPDATVGLQRWGEHRSALEWRTTTDASGCIEWISAPRDTVLDLYAHQDGYCMTRDVKLKADGQERMIVLHRSLIVHGRVVDAETGQGIRDFRAVPGYGDYWRYHDSELRWFHSETVRGTNGLFNLTFVETNRPWQLRIVAEGYEDWTSDALTNQASMSLDIALQPARPEECVRGMVLNPDNTPAAGAQVALLSLEHNVRLLPQRVFQATRRWLVTTDSDGQFRFTKNRLAHSVAAVNNEGYVQTRVRDAGLPLALQLQPWGRVEGRVDPGAKTQPVESIELYDPAADNYQGRVRMEGYSAQLDASSRFVFESVPPGEFSLFINSLRSIPHHHQTPILVKPGQTTQAVIIEQSGALVRGRFIAPVGRKINWSKEKITAHLQRQGPPLPVNSVEEGTLKAVEFWTSPAGRERINTRRFFYLRVDDDGSFVSVERVPSGVYRLYAVFENGSLHREVVVSAEDEPMPTLDLGPVQLRP